jgi:hypothetical protein
MARKFFYVCAGLFLLALSYQLGVRSATAQSGSLVVAGDIDRDHEGGIAAVVGRTLYCGTVRPPLTMVNTLPPVPGTAPIVAVYGPDPTVILGNGDVYFGDGSGWTLQGNFLSGSPTPALRESWGQLKSRYAPKSAPVLQTPTDK